jgi:hypothetical protein
VRAGRPSCARPRAARRVLSLTPLTGLTWAITTSAAGLRTHPRRLSRAECRAWIATHDEARLRFQTGRGPRSVVVGYALAPGEVVLLLPEYHPATGYLVDAAVTIEVEGASGDGVWESVRASGVAYRGAPAEAATLHPYGARWPTGVATHTVHVPLAEVEGVVRAA